MLFSFGHYLIRFNFNEAADASDRRTGSLVQFRRLGFEAGDLVEGVLVHCAREIKSPASLAPIYNE